MQSFASLPRRCIGRADLSICTQAISSILSCAHVAAFRSKPRLLSDLGKTLQAQPALRHHVRDIPDIQRAISTLFSLAAGDPDLFSNPVNVSQLATAQLKTGHYSSDFWARVELAGLDGMSAREFSNIVHAAAKLRDECGAPPPSRSMQQCMWRALRAGGHRMAAEMNSWDVSNIWWALAKLELHVPADIADALAATTARAARRMVPQEAANTWWAFAALGLAVPAPTHASLHASTAALAPDMTPQGVAITWLALAKLGLAVPDATHAALHAAAVRVAPDLTPQGVANTWFAFAKLALALPAATDAALQAATVRVAPDLAQQEVTNILWALASLQDLLNQTEMTAHVMHAVVRCHDELTVQGCCNGLWALGVFAVSAVPFPGRPQGRGLHRGLHAVHAVHAEAVTLLTGRLAELVRGGASIQPEGLCQVGDLHVIICRFLNLTLCCVC